MDVKSREEIIKFAQKLNSTNLSPLRSGNISLKAQNNNFVISSYPRAFTCNKTLTEFELDTKFQGTHGMSFKKGDVFKYDIVSIQTAIPTSSSEPLKGHLVAAGFLFSNGNFVKEIPYDPEYYFHGEELAIAVKLFTRGWDVFHIPKTPLFQTSKKRLLKLLNVSISNIFISHYHEN